jgi:hypothetical protein
MSTSRDLDRLMEAFLEDGPTVLTDRVLDAIRDDVDRTEQRADAGPWRTLFMQRPLFAAAVVIAVLGGLAIYAAMNPRPDIGPPAESAAPSPTNDELGTLPEELGYPFLGPAKAIPDITGIDRGDLYFENSVLAYEVGARTAFFSSPSITADGDLRLTTGANGVCAVGDEGTYPWSLSPGGTLLTIEPGADDCEVRAQVIPGSYERAACRNTNNDCLGELEAGDYVSHYFEPRPLEEWSARHGAMTYTVPSGWAAYQDWPHLYGLTPQSEYSPFSGQDCYDCPGTRDVIAILGNPGAATLDCLEEETVPGVGFGTQDLVDWLSQHPGLVASEPEEWSVGGRPATSLVIEGAEDWTGTCDEANPFVAVPIFYHPDGYHWALGVGTRYHVTLIDLGDGDTVAVVVDTADEENFEAFVEEARPIIESFEFPPH